MAGQVTLQPTAEPQPIPNFHGRAGARDANAGKGKAAVCAACHGPDGVSVNPAWPSLAGQQPVYLARQMRLFRDGVRVEPTTQPFVQVTPAESTTL